MTSSTVRVGSIRVRTVIPSAVVTLFVGTRPGLPWLPAALRELEALVGVVIDNICYKPDL